MTDDEFRVRDWVPPVVREYRSGRTLVLLLDYDGTLTPITRHPSLARLSAANRDRLARLTALPRVAVGVLSGRALAEVRDLVGLEDLYYAGSGGLDLDLRGERRTYPHATAFGRVLDAIQDDLVDTLRRYPGTWAERKPAALALHYRGLLPLAATCFRFDVTSVLARLGVVRFRVVSEAIEVTPVEGWDKGTAVEMILAHLDTSLFPVYVGDAANDREGMAIAAEAGGLAVGVGPDAPADARHRLAGPGELERSLDKLIAALGADHGAGLGSRNAEGPECECGRPGIVLLDPDPAGRTALADAMARLGWRVWPAGTPAEAAAAVVANREAIHAAVVDLRLPGLQGSRALGELGQLHPGLVRCVMSADITPHAAAAFRRLSDTPLFPRPFPPEQLDHGLRERLARSEGVAPRLSGRTEACPC